MLDIRQFRQFIAVAEDLNFRKAAQRLNMAQPPLTVAIRRIEAELGVLLLERTSRSVRLTEAGEVFLQEARRILSQAEWAAHAARRAALGLTGLLRIGFVATSARELLPSILLRFRGRYPEVELELSEGSTAIQIAALNDGKIDIGFVIPPIADTSGLTIQRLWQNRLIAALPASHALARKDIITLADVAVEKWVMLPAQSGHGLHELITRACVRAGFAPRVAQQARLMDTIVSLIAGGLGVGLVSCSLAAEDRKGVEFREIVGQECPIVYDVCLVHRRSNPIIKAFLDCVNQQPELIAARGAAADEAE